MTCSQPALLIFSGMFIIFSSDELGYTSFYHRSMENKNFLNCFSYIFVKNCEIFRTSVCLANQSHMSLAQTIEAPFFNIFPIIPREYRPSQPTNEPPTSYTYIIPSLVTSTLVCNGSDVIAWPTMRLVSPFDYGLALFFTIAQKTSYRNPFTKY